MCQVHTGAYVLLLAPINTDYTACYPKKDYYVLLHVAPIPTHTHERHKSIGKKKQREENKTKERRDKEAKNEKGKERKEKAKKNNKRKDKKEEAKKGEEKRCDASRP